MDKFKFVIEKEQIDCWTVYWTVAGVENTSRTKDFMTEQEARKFAENLKHEDNVFESPTCEYRRIVDLTKPMVSSRG